MKTVQSEKTVQSTKRCKLQNYKGRFQKPQARKLSVGGVPPSPQKTAFFAQKTPFLGQFLMDFFLTEMGGYPPSPLHGRRTVGSQKPNGKKLTERGVTPPP